MPVQVTAAPAVSQQAAQQTISRALQHDLAAAWLLLNVGDLAGTLPRFVQAVTALVYQYGSAAASVAADFYESLRAAARVAGTFTVPVAEPASVEQVARAMGWATRELWAATPRVEAARRDVGGAVEKLVLDASRNTLVDAVGRDRQAVGFARVAHPGACAFCAMLASRGAVYKTGRTALFTRAGRSYHDRCSCTVQPLFRGQQYELTGHAAEWDALWARTTAGKSPREARLAFRQALETS